MKKRGMSAEDKRRVILDVYHDVKEPFNLKEIENTASKLVSLISFLCTAISIVELSIPHYL